LFGFLIVVAAVDSDWPGIKEARQQCVAKYAINSSISNTQRGREKIKRFGLQEMTGKRRRRRKKGFVGLQKKKILSADRHKSGRHDAHGGSSHGDKRTLFHSVRYSRDWT
jgi:hypothetical protein